MRVQCSLTMSLSSQSPQSNCPDNDTDGYSFYEKSHKRRKIRYEPIEAKRLADARWRSTLNGCYDELKKILTVPVALADGLQTPTKTFKSRIGLLSDTLAWIDEMENRLQNLCDSLADTIPINQKPTLQGIKHQYSQKQFPPKNVSKR